MSIQIKITLRDYLLGKNYEKNLLDILESDNSEVILKSIKGTDDEDDFLKDLSWVFDEDSEYLMKFLTEGSFQTLINVFGITKILEVFETVSLPDEPSVCAENCDKCTGCGETPTVDSPNKGNGVPSDSVDSDSIVNEFTWHSEAVFDVLGNNEDTIEGRLLNESIVEVFCKVKNPIFKKNVLHRVHMGQRVSADSLVFDVEDGILRISICEPEPEVLLF